MSEPTEEFHVFYECNECSKRHRGTEQTPPSVLMVPGKKSNEWVFRCEPACKK